MIEVAGAGCASAIAAFLLGNSHEADHPPLPVPPAVVHLAPADEQMIRHVRDENAALVEQLRNTADARSSTAGTVPATAPAPAAQKPAKSASNVPASTPARREQKTTRTTPVEAKQRPADPPPVAAAVAPYGTDHSPWANARPAESKEIRVSAPAVAAPTESSPAPAQVPSRLWPAAASSVRDAPRPPIGVGEFTSSSM